MYQAKRSDAARVHPWAPAASVLAVFVCASLLTACGSEPGADPYVGGEAGDGPRITPALTLADLSAGPPDAVPVPDDTNIDGATEYQRAILADGSVTFDEYERATFDAIACLKDAGFMIYAYPDPERPGKWPGPGLSKRGEYQYIAEPHDPSADPLKAQADQQTCENQFSSAVRHAWVRGISPTYEDLQAARDAIGACLREAGYEVPEHPSGGDMMRLAFPPDGIADANQRPPEDYLACSKPIAELIGFRAYLGQ